MAANVTIKASTMQIELVKALVKYRAGQMDQADFITVAQALGYNANVRLVDSFVAFAEELALKVLSGDAA